MTVSQRFLRYVRFDTKSDEFSETCPSTKGQLAFADFLAEEMKSMGIADARVDENGYVYGSVPGDPSLPTVGLIAHMDTSPACSGADIQPKIVSYTGGDILLSEQTGLTMEEKEFPSLTRNRGKHLIVTDGSTLLGADDKAGIAEILAAAQQLMTLRRAHATLKICFTPDEEIGRGADRFDLGSFAADWAYTVDGGTLGELEYENFNAASAVVVFKGVSIHPGSAKGKLRNAQLMAMEFNGLLPAYELPELTEGYEGFHMLDTMEGGIESATLRYIIRDHDMEKFQAKKAQFQAAADFLNGKYGPGAVSLTLRDSYYNMKEKILPVMFVVEQAKDAMVMAGMEPHAAPIRGGTDGARLSYEGLPCPNLCTGGENYHGRFEYIPIEDMEACVQMLVHLLQNARRP